MAGIRIPKHPDAIFQVCGSVGNGRQARQNSIACEVREFLFCFAFLATTPGLHRKKCKARLGCTEKSVRLARTTITSTPRSVNDVEVRSISNLLVDQGGLLPVRAMECQLFM